MKDLKLEDYPQANGFFVEEAFEDDIGGVYTQLAKGFYTNGASYENYLVPFVGGTQDSNGLAAFTFHDALYSKGTHVKRRTADKALQWALTQLGRPAYQRRLIDWGLWLGGRFYYGKQYPQFVTPQGLQYARPATPQDTGCFLHLGINYTLC